MPNTIGKTKPLLKLAKLRQSTRLADYDCIGDFHGGIFECDYVSPLTKSGNNVDANIMIIAQDWACSNELSSDPPDSHTVEFGYNPKYATNPNLDKLLVRHFGLERGDCYLTNLFPFIKLGKADAPLRFSDQVESAKQFTLKEISIVSPQIAICLGLSTFTALMRSVDIVGSPRMDEAINSPFKYRNTIVHCVAHTGNRGMSNRGRNQVEVDWQNLAATFCFGGTSATNQKR